MISVICVFNSKECFDNNIRKSLQTQTVPYELIPIDNTMSVFDSAVKALGQGACRASGEYLMFVHQDVVLPSPDWLKDAEVVLNGLVSPGIIGVAGASHKGRIGFIQDSNCLFGEPIAGPVEAQTVDECLFIIPKKIYDEHGFDKKIKGWHAYAADYSLTLQKKGFRSYVVPVFIWHNSIAGNTEGLVRAQAYIYFKHFMRYRNIYTTCGVLNLRNVTISLLNRLMESIFKGKARTHFVRLLKKHYEHRTTVLFKDRKFNSVDSIIKAETDGYRKILYVRFVDNDTGLHCRRQKQVMTKAVPGERLKDNKEVVNVLISDLLSPVSVCSAAEIIICSLNGLFEAGPEEIGGFIEHLMSMAPEKMFFYYNGNDKDKSQNLFLWIRLLEEKGFSADKLSERDNITGLEKEIYVMRAKLDPLKRRTGRD